MRHLSLRRLNAGVGALAAATLLLESTLTRLLAVAQFYHFAFLVVSLALLGFGASGSILAILPRLGRTARDRSAIWRIMTLSGLGFSSSVGLAYLVVNLLPFDSYSIAWERRQILYFVLYYLALGLPFLFAGLGIGGALVLSAGRSHLVYAANLLGSGAGALLAPLALWLSGVPGAVLSAGLVGLLGVTLFFHHKGTGRLLQWGAWSLLLLGMVGFILLSVANLQGQAPVGMTISQYKGLAHALRYPGATRIFGRWNAISRIDVVAEAGTRQLPGLSYSYPGIPPPQYGLSLDADDLQPITLIDPDEFEAAAYLPEAVAFSLRPQARALVLEPGSGLGVLQALAGGAETVTAVVGNPLVPHAVASTAPQTDIFVHPQVRTVLETPRVFLQRDQDLYSLVFLPLTDTYRPVTSGAYSLGETYNLTVEAFEAMLSRLEPEGILIVTRWLQTPPSECLRLIATLVTALERQGISEVETRLVAYRGIQTMTVLVQPSGWDAADLSAVQAFAEDRRYDLVWAPGITPEETNRFNRLPESIYYENVHTMLTTPDRLDYFAGYPFAIDPPTDNQPFFFHFFTWGQTPELLATLGRTWQPFGGSGYFVLLALLALVLCFSVALILAPLMIVSTRKKLLQAERPPASLEEASNHRPAGQSLPTRQGEPLSVDLPRIRIFLYFGLLGLAFLFVEIPLIQRWILLLGHPTYAFMVVVVVLLTFSGIGSALARSTWLPRRTAFAALVAMALITPFIANQLAAAVLGWPALARGVIAAVSLFPLAVLMGLPFPLGLAWLEEQAPQLIPWAWAVNGCTSVVAAVLAAIFSLSYGFTLVLLFGAAAYFVAWVIYINSHP